MADCNRANGINPIGFLNKRNLSAARIIITELKKMKNEKKYCKKFKN